MLKNAGILVCSNRENQEFNLIWRDLINQKNLDKVILATQGKANKYRNKEKKVLHLPLNSKGRSKAINDSLKKIHTFAIGLTDDDCVLDRFWLKEALNSIEKRKVDLVYGQTKPYKQYLHPGKFCPSTFKKEPNTFSITNSLGKHWIDVGFDNNAMIKREVFDQIGGYKPWLGPGALVPAAEDGEFILRAIIAGYKIAYQPKMLVRHNRFLNKEEEKKQLDAYVYGGLVTYGFYFLQGVKELKPIYYEYLEFFYRGAKDDLKEIVRGRISKKVFLSFFEKVLFLIKGMFFSFIFAKIIPIPEKEKVVEKFYKKKYI